MPPSATEVCSIRCPKGNLSCISDCISSGGVPSTGEYLSWQIAHAELLTLLVANVSLALVVVAAPTLNTLWDRALGINNEWNKSFITELYGRNVEITISNLDFHKLGIYSIFLLNFGFLFVMVVSRAAF